MYLKFTMSICGYRSPHNNIYGHSSTLLRNFVTTITKHISIYIYIGVFLYGWKYQSYKCCDLILIESDFNIGEEATSLHRLPSCTYQCTSI